jgi:hypothetical protein
MKKINRKLPIAAIMLAVIGLVPIGIATVAKACPDESPCSNDTCQKEDSYGGTYTGKCYYDSTTSKCAC